MTQPLACFLDPLPLIAVLRGITPEEIPAVGAALVANGFRILEVPLNRPGALECIATLCELKLPGALVGGGTMLRVADVDAVHAAGGQLFVSPNCNPAVIAHAVGLGMLAAPGVATPTEAFAALDAGAHALKLFPFETIGLGGLKALLSVLPAGTALWPVGGVTPQSISPGVSAGATGFGIGSQLFRPGVSLAALADAARAFVAAWSAAAR